jgi:hypothetical protein
MTTYKFPEPWRYLKALSEHNESVIRDALGRWVSELDPVLFQRAGELSPYGIGVDGFSEPIIFLPAYELGFEGPAR